MSRQESHSKGIQMEPRVFNWILSLTVDLRRLLRSSELHVSSSSRPISHFPERLTDVGTMQIYHVLYLGKTATPTIDRISLSLTRDVDCTQNGPDNSFTFCEHSNITWTEVLECGLHNLSTRGAPVLQNAFVIAYFILCELIRVLYLSYRSKMQCLKKHSRHKVHNEIKSKLMHNLRFSRPWLRRMPPCGILRIVALVRTDVSQERVVFILGMTRIGELGTTLATISWSALRKILFLRSVFRLLVNTNVVPSSPILVTLILEAIYFSETSVLIRDTRRNIPEDDIRQK
jgi:hypothetical protein